MTMTERTKRTMPYPAEKEPLLLHETFERAAKHFPNEIALDIPDSEDNFSPGKYTYATVEARANILAGLLHPLAVKARKANPTNNLIMAIFLPRRSHHLYEAELAVMKAGGAYTCIDPVFPEKRVRFILEDSEPVAVVSLEKDVNFLLTCGYSRDQIVTVEAVDIDVINNVTHPFKADIKPSDICYVIYTSGTTGQPKGVLIEHRNAVNIIMSDFHFFLPEVGLRSGQFASTSYDVSIQEIYIAFAAAGTVVLMNDDVSILGPDLVPWMNKNEIMALCPTPTFLRTLGPQSHLQLPHLKIIYVGGEALPSDVAEKWASVGTWRWLVNGYGPTECAVVITRKRIFVGDVITIGKVVRGNEALVLSVDDGKLLAVEKGQPGELCIRGVNVGRGYLNRPEKTAECFFQHPEFGRIYRTGDLVCYDEKDELAYKGRIDSQVKIRGYRIELSEIEAVLCQFPGVTGAAANVQNDGETPYLVAFCVPTLGAPAIDFEKVRAYLLEQLPKYMVPAHFASIEKLPFSAHSGKIDRAALPVCSVTKSHAHRRRSSQREEVEPARTHMEQLIGKSFLQYVGVGMDERKRKKSVNERGDGAMVFPFSVTDDFFELGGNSVLAASVVSHLRLQNNPLLSQVTVRDIYQHRNVRAIARMLDAGEEKKLSLSASQNTTGSGSSLYLGNRPILADDGKDVHYAGHFYLVSIAQLLFLMMGVCAFSAFFYFFVFYLFEYAYDYMGINVGIALLPLLITLLRVLTAPFVMLFAVLVKWLVIGRYQSVSTPMWSWLYFRVWVMQKLMQILPWPIFAGTEFQNCFFRWLGAHIGKNVHIDMGVTSLLQGGWDLLEIGDNAVIQRDAQLRLVDYTEYRLEIGPIRVGMGAVVDVRAAVHQFCVMEPFSVLTPLSMLQKGETVGRHEIWHGCPAKPHAQTPAAPKLTIQPCCELNPYVWSMFHIMNVILMQFAGQLPGTGLMIMVLDLLAVGDSDLNNYLNSGEFNIYVVLAGGAFTVANAVFGLFISALALRLMGSIKAGVYSRWSIMYSMMWIKMRAVEAAGQLISGTLYYPYWLRAAGMKVGQDCEISSIFGVIPELINISKEVFFADGIYLGGPKLSRGTVTVGQTSLGTQVFLGNHAVIPTGTHLPDNVLLGVGTLAADDIKQNTGWFGHPKFQLPRREIVEVDASGTFKPTRCLWFQRVWWETFRFVIPVPLGMTMFLYPIINQWQSEVEWYYFWGGILPAFTYVSVFALALLTWMIKWGLLGKVKPKNHPLWSCWVSRWDFVYITWQQYVAQQLAFLNGTIYMSLWLRCMGATLGKRVLLNGAFSQLVDPDMITIEDFATVSCFFQAHSFEDRVLKIAPLRIGAGSTVGDAVILLYGADIGNNSMVENHSVVMKHEVLNPNLYYVGAPVIEAKAPVPIWPGSQKEAMFYNNSSINNEHTRFYKRLNNMYVHAKDQVSGSKGNKKMGTKKERLLGDENNDDDDNDDVFDADESAFESLDGAIANYELTMKKLGENAGIPMARQEYDPQEDAFKIVVKK